MPSEPDPERPEEDRGNPPGGPTGHPGSIQGDRLYGITMRPQELALYGDKVTFSLRYSPIFDEADVLADQHFRLLVLEIHGREDGDAAEPVGKTGHTPRSLQLLKCGWEIELRTATRCRVDSVLEASTEVPLLLGRIADTVNDLARRAGLEAPLGPSVIADLLSRYAAETAIS